jgi:hypothetical protein
MEQIGVGADLEALWLDSTIVHAPQHAAFARKNGPQAKGRSRCEPSTKFHTAMDAMGNPACLILTSGQISDIKQAPSFARRI